MGEIAYTENPPHVAGVMFVDVENFPDYIVGDDGSVWSHKWGYWRKLKPAIGTPGYPGVILQRNRKGHNKLVHVLVCAAFNGPCSLGMECRHIDGTRTNGTAKNLEWGTQSENMQDKVRHGTSMHPNSRGELNHDSKLKEWQVLEIRESFRPGVTLASLGRKYGVTYGTIGHIVQRKTWKHI